MPRQDVVIEFYYSGAWHPVTAYGRDPVTIARGKRDEGSALAAQTATFTLDNRDGRWSTFNPASPLYGLVGQNTPVRITLTDYRFWGEVASMRPDHSPDYDQVAGRGDAWVEVEAAGPLRRILAGTDPIPSPVRAAILDAAPTDYWPLEESGDATEATNLVDGRPPLRARTFSQYTDPSGAVIPPAGLPKFGTGNGIPGSLPVVDMAEGGALWATLDPGGINRGSWRVGFVVVLPRDMQALGTVPIRWQTTTSKFNRWSVQFDSGGIFIAADDEVTATAGYTLSWSGLAPYDGRPHYIEVEAFNVSGAMDVRLYVDNYQVDPTLSALNGASLNDTVGSITRVDLNPLDANANQSPNYLPGMPQLGHVAIWQPVGPLVNTAVAMGGYVGESTIDRYQRLCDRAAVAHYYAGPDPADVQAMGVQRSAPLGELLAEVERTEAGLLYETRGGVGLVLVTGRGMHGVGPDVTLDYAAGHLAPGSRPVLDDQGVTNAATAKSTTTNAAATRELTTGPYSVSAPPAGIGRYETTVEVNPADPGRLADYAGRAVAAGTRPGLRWPRLVVDVATNAAVRAGVCGLDPGDHVRVVNLPAHVTPDAVDLVVIGTVEVIGTHTRTVDLVCRPYDVVDAPVVGVARADSETSTLAVAATSSTPTLSVTRATGSAKWTTDPAAFPFDVRLDVDGGTGGERVTVTGIAGTGATQTFTVARSVNGVVRSWPVGTRVRLWSSPTVGL